MDKNSTIPCEGLFTRWGGDIKAIHGFGHSVSDPENRPPSYKPLELGEWWAVCDVHYPDTDEVAEKRRVFVDAICYDSTTNENGKSSMEAVSKACMDYLLDNGRFYKGGYWIPDL